MQKLHTLLNELETTIPQQALIVPAVSSASIGWHIEHSLLVLDASIKALHKSDPVQYKWSFGFWRTVIFLSGSIPRGRAKAPDRVQPSQSFDEGSLLQHVSETKTRLEGIDTIGKNQFMKHPYFGMLNRKQTIQFMELHTRHHLKIIRDILQSRA